MAAHRYWKLSGTNHTNHATTGEISQIDLLGVYGELLDFFGAGAVVTASHAPNSGALSNLLDNVTTTFAQWTAGQVKDAGFWIKLDLLRPIEVAAHRLRHQNSNAFRVDAWTLEYSDDDASYTNFGTYSGVAYTNGVSARQGAAALEAPAHVRGGLVWFDGVHGGVRSIFGTVRNDGSPDYPVKRRVRLFHRLTGTLVRETWSDPTSGEYEFAEIDAETYFVVSHDHTGVYNAVIADAIVGDLP